MSELTKKRIGNDIVVKPVLTATKDGREIQWTSAVKAVVAFNDVQRMGVHLPFEVSEGVLTATFKAEQQKYLGVYRIMVVVDDGNTATWDAPSFELVPFTEMADEDTLGLVAIEVKGELQIVTGGAVWGKILGDINEQKDLKGLIDKTKPFVATPYETTYEEIQAAIAEGRTVIAEDDEERYFLLGTYDGYTFARLIANGFIWGYHISEEGEWSESNDYMLFTEQNMTDLWQEIQKKADDNGVVHKTGEETINGPKEFLADIILSANVDGTRAGGFYLQGYHDFSVIEHEDGTLQEVLDDKANDNGVVHKTGNETIDGRKTFKGPIIMEAKQDSDENWQLTSEVIGEKNVMNFQGTLTDVIIRGVGVPEYSSDAVNLEYLEDTLDNYANDGSVVHNFGVETISGEKYFKDGFKADSLIGQQIALLNEDQSIDNINILNSSTDDDFVMELMDDLVNQPVIVRGVKSPKGDSDATNKKYVDDKLTELSQKVDTKPDEAPKDGKAYTRKDGEWVEDTGGDVPADIVERLEDLENDRKYSHNLGKTRIKDLSVDEPIKVCDAPMVLIGSGAPSASNVPQNWNKETMGEWFGIPNFVGQMYVNVSASSNALYIAVNDTAVSGWKSA